jgi:hypothetical protein
MARFGPQGPSNRPRSSKGAMYVPGKPIHPPTVSRVPARPRPTTAALCRTGATTSPEPSNAPLQQTGRWLRPTGAVPLTAGQAARAAQAGAAAPLPVRALRAAVLTAVPADPTAARAAR